MYTYTHKGIYVTELAHVIIGTGKSEIYKMARQAGNSPGKS